MTSTHSGIETLEDIRKIMERSSRFISLSGWSGIAAGLCAIIGAWLGYEAMGDYHSNGNSEVAQCVECLRNNLIWIAAGVFAAAVFAAFIFTYIRSKRDGVAIWGNSARKLLWSTLVPMAVGGAFILRLIQLEEYQLVASASLIFYGLGLLNGSKYTLGEIRFLGYAQLLTGIISLWFTEYAIIFWAIGFGLLHIIYGIAMWWKYDRNK